MPLPGSLPKSGHITAPTGGAFGRKYCQMVSAAEFARGNPGQPRGYRLLIHRLLVESASTQMPVRNVMLCTGLSDDTITVALRGFVAQMAAVSCTAWVVPSAKPSCRSTGAGIPPTLLIVTV